MTLREDRIYRAAILHIQGIGSQRLRQLLACFGTAKNAWEAREDTESRLEGASWFKKFLLERLKIDPEKIRLKLMQEDISLVALGEKHYPFLLAECQDAPPLLFYRGVLKPHQEGIAVVGARKATPYGKAAASCLARGIAESGYVIVSGLARGIDTAAHQGALAGNGVTWAFLAGGLDSIYPVENIKLARSISEKGALLSEYCPGMRAEAGNFPARNRLISGASRGVVVVEAAGRSGSLITVDFALEQGREVFAVPGPIFSEQSRGTHHLLKMGAKLVENKEDILSEISSSAYFLQSRYQNGFAHHKLEEGNSGKENEEEKNEELNIQQEKTRRYAKREKRKGNEDWDIILESLSDTPLHIDRLTALCPIPAQQIALGLLELQLAEKIIQMPGQYYVLKR